MGKARRIGRIYVGRRSRDGAGVNLSRIFGYHETPDFDPFLLLDFFDSMNPEDYIRGFPWHPHRGIQTVTYLIHGSIRHEDNLGNGGVIYDGDCQWMSAGSGIVHQEMPLESRHMYGVQLWVNLPAELKMTKPSYMGIQSNEIPTVDAGSYVVKVIAGSYGNIDGPVKGIAVEPSFMDVEVSQYEKFSMDMDSELNVAVFVLEGKAFFDTEKRELLGKGSAAILEDGQSMEVSAGSGGVRFLYLAGRPLRESIEWRGPIVMNTREEIESAFDELDRGTFIKDRAD